jgi:hypothetical protein
MKIEIDKTGQMNVFAETGIEAYALMKWGEENFVQGKTPKMLLDYSLDGTRKIDEILPHPEK